MREVGTRREGQSVTVPSTPNWLPSSDEVGFELLTGQFLASLEALHSCHREERSNKPMACGLGGFTSEVWFCLQRATIEALTTHGGAAPIGTVDGGNTRWLKALVDPGTGALHHKVCPTTHGHCTLAYAPPLGSSNEEAIAASDVYQSYLQECGLQEGRELSLHVDGIVADQQCIALTVRAVNNDGEGGQLETPTDEPAPIVASKCITVSSAKAIRHTPLHITMALREGTAPFYAAELCESIAQLDLNNAEAMRLRARKRERELDGEDGNNSKVVKCRNFIHITFKKPLAVVGKVYIN
eukprot:GILI01036885.1.p1 GENE.GILI01036885.1~~GILI01036885.1.p1  ORF type:complete len:314 (-),score=46.17 GILI01036885.1:20-913(-)